MEAEEINEFYSIKEFAEKLHVHPNTIRKAINTGYINALRTGNGKKSSYRIPHTEIHKLALLQWNSVVQKVAHEQNKIESAIKL